jgi:hypothetical protein
MLVNQPAPFNFVDLYIPSNPFNSLANNVVPAVVLFSVIVGVALIGVEWKQMLLDVLRTATQAVARATQFIVRLTPYGLFAIAATAAGTLSVEQLGRLQVYLVTYVAVAFVLALWVLPGLVAAVTPIGAREMLSLTRNARAARFSPAIRTFPTAPSCCRSVSFCLPAGSPMLSCRSRSTRLGLHCRFSAARTGDGDAGSRYRGRDRRQWRVLVLARVPRTPGG